MITARRGLSPSCSSCSRRSPSTTSRTGRRSPTCGTSAEGRMLRLIERLQRFFASWRFPAFVLSLLVAFDAVMLLVLLVPAPSALQRFTDEFRIWCFGYDPQKKTVEIAY